MRTRPPSSALQDALEVLFSRSTLEGAHSPTAAALLWGAGLWCRAGAPLPLRSGRALPPEHPADGPGDGLEVGWS